MTVQVHEAATLTVPTTMRAAAIDRYGGPEVLTIHVLPVPKLDAGEVLIAVHTAGVGGWDADIRAGWSPGGRPHFPLVLGTDGSGTVAAVGSHVRRFKRGDKVYAYREQSEGRLLRRIRHCSVRSCCAHQGADRRFPESFPQTACQLPP